MTRTAARTIKIDVRTDSALWNDTAAAIVRRAVAQAAAALSTSRGELAIVLTDDSAIRSLNRQWRGIDAATNVLSFPSRTIAGQPPHIGDVVLAYQTIARQARAARKPFVHHLAHLAVHGYLHLLGYDHEEDKQAEAMEGAERRVLRRLAIPDPYGRSVTAPKSHSKTTAKRRNLTRIPKSSCRRSP
jgi:probable rRNA maturation factor